ncbi:SWI/SNF chromatin-remodeling complex subunit [Microbotryomycetes sp. JL201]|nr:SWI/SNF chromatin-remodeling complex subunit [Microbotryomycetes sp. JL201]
MNGYSAPIAVNGVGVPMGVPRQSMAQQQPGMQPMLNTIRPPSINASDGQSSFANPFASMPAPAPVPANAALAQQQQQLQHQQQQQMPTMRSRTSASAPSQHPSLPLPGMRGGPPRPITAPTDGGPPYKVPLHPIYTRMSYTEPGETFPSLSAADQLRVKAWMDRDHEYEQALFASRKASRKELMTMHQDWIRREDWLGLPDQPAPPRFAIRFPADRIKEQAKGKRGNSRQTIKLSKRVAATAAEQQEVLIPIRIDCENEAYKIRETFTWNLKESSITPEMLASHMVEDLRVPNNPFYKEIVLQIRRHIEDAQLTENYTTHLDNQYHEARESSRRWFVERASVSGTTFRPEEDENGDRDVLDTAMRSAVGAAGPDRELRIVIRLDVTQDNVQIVDKFEWDLSDSLNSPEDFAEIYAADLGLSGEFKTAIAHSIREQLDMYVRSLCIIGYTPGTFITDEELRSEFLAHVAEPIREDPSDYTPLINYLTPEELERNDREREREVRRKRRQTKGRGTTLPERDRPKTHRTTVPKPSKEPIAPFLDARGDTVWPQPEVVYAYPIETESLVPKPPGLDSPAESPLRLTKPALPPSILDSSAINRGPGRPHKRFKMADGQYGSDSPGGAISPSDGTPAGTPGPEVAGKRGPRKRGGPLDEKWNCVNCGIPGFMSTGRRKGPQGSNTLCGMCGKYYNRYKRNRPVQYTTDPEYHRRVNAEYEAAAAVAGVEQSANARLEEEHQRARATGTMRPKRVLPDSSDESDDSQVSAVPLAHRKVRGQSPDLPFVDVGSDSESSASASAPPTPRRANAAPSAPQRPQVPVARPPPPPPPEPLPWMKTAAAVLRSKQVDDRFEIIPRPRAPDGGATLEWRIRCLDCPGKLYNLGPGETLDNFAIHFRNKQHRANVDARLGRSRPVDAPPPATSGPLPTAPSASGPSDAADHAGRQAPGPSEDVRHWSAPIEAHSGHAPTAMTPHSDPRMVHEQHYITYCQAGRPPLGQYHSFPPAPRSPSYQGVARPSSQMGSAHASYHPYSPPGASVSPKKQLLFINSSSNDPAVNKPKRKRISPEQLEHLLELFNQTDAPTFDQREKVAQATAMTNREVQIWFQNRRAKVIRERERANKLGQSPSDGAAASPRSRGGTANATRAKYTASMASIDTQFSQTQSESSVEPDTPGASLPAQSAPPASFTASPTLALPPPPHGQAPPMMLPPAQNHTSRMMTAEQLRFPGSAGSSTRATFARSIELPSPSLPAYSPGVQPHRSPSGVIYSPSTYNPTSYFGIPSPSLSSSYGGSHLFTPNPGSAYSTSSSYFSHHEPGLYSPNTALSSPTGNFFRLSLDSPGCFSPRTAGPQGAQHPGMQFERSPRPSEHYVHLAPITSPGLWGSQQSSPYPPPPLQAASSGEAKVPSRTVQGHKRSQSDTAVLSQPGLDDRPSERATGSKTTMSQSVSLPNSPQDSRQTALSVGGDSLRSASPAMQIDSTSLTSQSGSVTMFDSNGRPHSAHRRRAGPRPSSLSHISHSIKEESSPPPPEPAVSAGGVGLGMLAMAASGETGEDLGDEDEEERAARQRYLATRKLSYVEVGSAAVQTVSVVDDVDMVNT